MAIRRSLKNEALNALSTEISGCTKCKLHTTRFKTVPGEGNYTAKIMFIGEGPGRDENLSGRPFVGRAGQFLTDIIEQEFKLQRKDVYICNIVKCRPSVDMKKIKDRPPDLEEVEACFPYLLKQIDIIKPLLIITLGNNATYYLLNIAEGITKLHGLLYEFNGIPVMPMYHPSYVIRNGGHSSKLKKDIVEAINTIFKTFKDIC